MPMWSMNALRDNAHPLWKPLAKSLPAGRLEGNQAAQPVRIR